MIARARWPRATEPGPRPSGGVEPEPSRRRPFPVRNAGLVALVVLLSACGGTAAPPEPPSPRGWTAGQGAPLSARYAPLLAWTGEEVLVFGGHTGPPCPPNADCVVLDDGVRDGAAYDPDSNAWRPLADSPVDLDRFTGHVVVDGDLVVGTPRHWWRYDVDGDLWTEVSLPVEEVGVPEVAAEGAVYTHVGRRVRALEVATGNWRALPPDPLRPPLTGTVFVTDAGVVLTGVNYREAAPDEPTLTQADVWDGRSWRRLPRTGMIGPLHHWTGERLVGLEVGGADGGEVNGWDRWYPFAGALDPASGTWSAIDEVPDWDELRESDWRIEAASGPLVATAGQVYEDTTGGWTHLSHPDSALTRELTGVWAGERLVVVGGSDDGGQVATETWVWTR